MPKPWRLTRQASTSIIEIARWTYETFGARQASAYEEDLIARCVEIASGTAISQDCRRLIDPDIAETLDWKLLPTEIGDIVFFDSYIPHRSGPNRTKQPRRALYITYNRASEGSYRESYYRCKRDIFPPDIERDPKKDYRDSGVFNVGNPIK